MPTSTPHFRGLVSDTGERFDARSDQTLLAAMGAAGIAWPVSCRNGTCRTCIGRLSVGRVHHVIPWPGLSAEELRDGHVLPCVAQPRSDVTLAPVGLSGASW